MRRTESSFSDSRHLSKDAWAGAKELASPPSRPLWLHTFYPLPSPPTAEVPPPSHSATHAAARRPPQRHDAAMQCVCVCAPFKRDQRTAIELAPKRRNKREGRRGRQDQNEWAVHGSAETTNGDTTGL